MSKERECLLWVDAFLLGQKVIGADGIAEIRRRVGNALRDERWPPAWVESPGPSSTNVNLPKDMLDDSLVSEAAIRELVERRMKEVSEKFWGQQLQGTGCEPPLLRYILSDVDAKVAGFGSKFIPADLCEPESTPSRFTLNGVDAKDVDWCKFTDADIRKLDVPMTPPQQPSDNYGPRDYGP